MSETKPTPDVKISHDLIDSLVKEFFPEVAGLPIEYVASGWDNEIHRIGTDHAVRLPRRKESAPLIENEQKWLATLAEDLPLEVPVPVYSGGPAFGFPWHWSIVRWIEGVPLLHAPQPSSEVLIEQLTKFLSALHVAAPDDAPTNEVRGIPLSRRASVVAQRIDDLVSTLEVVGIEPAPLSKLWSELVEAAPWTGDSVWIHGDLHPGNLLVRGSRLAGVIDFGDLCAGDPATDISIAWMILDSADDRNSFRQQSAVGAKSIDSDTWKRSRAWAINHATAILAATDGDPSLRRMAIKTLNNVLGR